MPSPQAKKTTRDKNATNEFAYDRCRSSLPRAKTFVLKQGGNTNLRSNAQPRQEALAATDTEGCLGGIPLLD